MGIHSLAPSLAILFATKSEPTPVFASEWGDLNRATRSDPTKTCVFERGVVATDLMPRIHALASSYAEPTSVSQGDTNWRAGASNLGGGVELLPPSSVVMRDAAVVSLASAVRMIYEPTLRVAALHRDASVVFVSDRPARGSIVRPPKEVTHAARAQTTARARAKRGVAGPRAYAPGCRFDVGATTFTEVDDEGTTVSVSSSVDLCRLLVSPETMAAFYLFFAQSVRALGVFNDAHFDLPGCQHVERAPIDPARAVLPEDFAPSHAFSEGDNCILHVARRAPTDAAVHAITVDTDAVVMLSCVIMLNPDNEGLWQPTRHAKQRVYWHSAIDMRAAAGSSTKERVWALHTLVDQFMQHRVAPHMLLATAILTGCDFLPHTHSITNISAENVWRAALEAAKGESHFNFPTDMSARGVLSHIATEVIDRKSVV